jgi:hypothetical protein
LINKKPTGIANLVHIPKEKIGLVVVEEAGIRVARGRGSCQLRLALNYGFAFEIVPEATPLRTEKNNH